MAEYDPEIIEEFADRLYSKALGIQIMATALGVLGGGFFAWVAVNVRSGGRVVSGTDAVLVAAAFFCGVIGFAIGRSMAFKYKLQAQTALCQVQIERNTRAKAEAASAR